MAAVSSGTAAIHLGLRLLGVGAGDEVFCSTLTFVASANPILYLGAQPVFIDSDRATWNMNPALLRDALGDRARWNRLPRAVVVVHLYGQCADMAPILDACRQYDVPVLEDAAESLGAEYRGRPAGTLGDIGVFSLNGNKIITGSAGGLLVARDRRWIERAKHWAAQAREPGPAYEHRDLGHNYGMSNVIAGIACGQLCVLDERIRRRREVARVYRAAFTDLDGIVPMPECEYGVPTCWLSAFLIDARAFGATRDELLRALATADIEARPVWTPLHLQPLFRGAAAVGGDVAEDLHRRGICLPSSSCLPRDDQDRVVHVVRSLARRGRARSRIIRALRSDHGDRDAERLLGRPCPAPDASRLAPVCEGCTILITGGGGTIGSELARQIAGVRPRRLVLFDRSEHDLCRVELELTCGGGRTDVVTIVGDVVDAAALNDVFSEFRPDVVLHAAAYKHVRLLERHPFTAIRNNALGSRAVATLSRRHGVSTCVLVSTDKAVSPTSVMGVSKRIAELVFLSCRARSGTRFRIARLGNVLGSSGSVVPLFERQIADGRPLTVTDPHATRYFITISDAARFLLEAGLLVGEGELFLPDMGDPVRILDLAHRLMDGAGVASGRRPVLLTGLRPGEKRHEELLFPAETVEPTDRPSIRRVRGPIPDGRAVRRAIRALRIACDRRDVMALVGTLRQIVPEFEPSSAFAPFIGARDAREERAIDLHRGAEERSAPLATRASPQPSTSRHSDRLARMD